MKKQNSDPTEFAKGSAIEEQADSPEQALNALFQHVSDGALASSTEEAFWNDTLALQETKDGAIHLKLSPASFGALIQDVAASVQPLMEQKRIAFVLDSPQTADAVILVDSPRFREIFIQLLSHAARFTPAGGRIELAAECLRLDPNGIHSRIVVRDSSVGAHEAFQANEFEAAHTEETTSCNESNLCLLIAKRLVTSMGGRIAVSRNQDAETECSVYLDFARLAGLPGNDSPTEAAGDVVGLKILLCEDNPISMEIARRILECNGAFVVPAVDGMEGYRKFMASRPDEFDLILMDLRMPNMDGYTAARNIRGSGHPGAKTIPILAVSSDAYATDIDKALASGMNGHLAKPINPQKLILEIYRLTKLATE